MHKPVYIYICPLWIKIILSLILSNFILKGSKCVLRHIPSEVGCMTSQMGIKMQTHRSRTRMLPLDHIILISLAL